MDNYTGPYWSDGKFQSSVEFGESEPLDALDEASRLHDSAYAHYKDEQHRRAADLIYYNSTKDLGIKGAAAGSAVLFGNQTLRSGSNLITNGGPTLPGLVIGGIKNMISLNDWSNNRDKYLRDVTDYYLTDPRKTNILLVDNNIPKWDYNTGVYAEMPEVKTLNDQPVRMTDSNIARGVGYRRSRRRARRYSPYHYDQLR